jgi:hypothetical protein
MCSEASLYRQALNELFRRNGLGIEDVEGMLLKMKQSIESDAKLADRLATKAMEMKPDSNETTKIADQAMKLNDMVKTAQDYYKIWL